MKATSTPNCATKTLFMRKHYFKSNCEPNNYSGFIETRKECKKIDVFSSNNSQEVNSFFYVKHFLILFFAFFSYNMAISQIYVNTFTGTSACPTNGNTPTVATNATGTAMGRSTITCNATANVFNSTTLNNTASISNTSYVEFSVTANSGYQLNLTSLSFFRQGSNTCPRQLEVRYSTDGFVTSTDWGSAPTTPTTGTTATWDFTDFSTAAAATITFRFYPYGTVGSNGTAGSAATTGTFRVDDVTLNGTVTALAGVPNVPTAISITPSNQQLSVAFTTPSSDGGSAITSYKYSTDGGTTFRTRAAGTTASPIVITTLSADGTTALTNGTSYNIQIRAVNANGDGTATASTAATPATTPSAPTLGTITASNGQLSVAFTAGATGGSAITNYQYSTDGGTTFRDRASGTTASPLVITTLSTDGTTALTNGTSYNIQLRAVNAIGSGTASISTAATPFTTPGAPTIGTITPSSGQLSVAFTAPGSTGGSAITNYQYSTDGGTTFRTRASGTTGSPLVISTLSSDGTTALTNGTSYNIQLKAVNAAGAGTATASTAATPYTTPGAPTIGTATAGDGQATVAFTAPASNGGSAITSYTVTSSPDNITANNTASPITVTGLTNGTSYTFTVVANNLAGAGAASAASNSITPAPGATVPGIPTNVSATAGNGQAVITFTAPSNGGDPIQNYTVTVNPGGATFTGTNTSITATGLTNGTAYTFTVTATNGVGTGTASAASNSVTPATVPGAPTSVSATAGNGQATISFTAPASNGGASITSYTVTSSPGNLTVNGGTSPLTITGLTNNVAYTFTVTATNSVGIGAASAASNSVTPVGTVASDFFRTKTSGNWASASTWESSFDGSTWISASLAPDANANTITILNSHTVTVGASVAADQLVVNTGGQITVSSGQTLTISDGTGTDLQVSGTISNAGTITPTGTISFAAASTYTHAQNGGAVPTATWNTTSNCTITGVTSTAPTGLNQSFGNFTWNCTGQTASVFLNNTLNTINGNFNFTSSNTWLIRLNNNSDGNSTLSVGGNLSVGANAGLNLNFGTTTGGLGTLNLSGNLTVASGGIITNSSEASKAVINFEGNGIKQFSNSGTTFNNTNAPIDINVNAGTLQLLTNLPLNNFSFNSSNVTTLTVASGATIDFGTFTISNGTNTTATGFATAVAPRFVLSSGATAITTNAAGLTASGLTGSVQVTGTRTYSSGANYEFRGAATGAFTTTPTASTVNNLTINNASGVTLSQPLTVAGTFSLSAGILTTTSTNVLTIGNTSVSAISGGSTTSFVSGPLRRTLPSSLASGTTYVYPIGKSSTYYPFALVNPVTGATGPVISAEAFATTTGGTAGANVASFSTAEYWNTSVVSGNLTSASVSLTRQAALSTLNIIARSSTLTGTYSSLAGTVSGTSINNSNDAGSSLGFFAMGVFGNTPPTLTAAPSATVDGAFDVTFTDDNTWRTAITGVTVGGTALTSGYAVTAGKITFTPSASVPAALLQSSGANKSIVITATGYSTATVSQTIAAGVATKLAMSTQPTAPTVNGAALAAQPVVTVLDQYNNIVNSSASITAAATSGLWTIGGTVTLNASGGTATFSGLTAGHTASVTGATITFTSTGLTPIVSGTFNIPAPDYAILSTVGVAYTQNFNTLGSSGTAALPQGFVVTSGASPTFAGGTTATTLTYGTAGTGLVTGSSSGGVINWAVGATDTATDRALGFLTTGSFTSPRGIIVKFRNNTGTTISNLAISYAYEKFRSGSRAFDFTFFTGTDGTSWSSNTSGDQSYAADANNTVINNPPTAISKSFNLTGVNIANGADYYLRWQYTGSGGNTNAQGLGLDNLSVTPVNPVISTSGTLSAVNTTYGSASTTPSSFNVSGANIQSGGITVTPPSGFEVSLSAASGYASSVTINSTGTVASTPIYVRLTATTTVVSSPYSGNIVLTSAGATSVNVATVSSSVSPRTITITAADVNKVYGSTLTSPAVVTTGYSIGGNGLAAGDAITNVTFTYGTGSASSAAIANYSGSVVPSSATGSGNFNATNYSISYIAGDINVGSAAAISVSGTLSALSATYGSPSNTTTSFTASGTQLIGNITVTPPVGFEVSTSSGFTTTIGTSASPLTLSQSGGTVNNTTIYVRLSASAGVAGSPYSGNIVLASSFATSVNVATASSTVNARDLTITANNVSKTYNSVLTSGAGSTAFTSTTLVGIESISTVTITYGTGASATDPVDVYTGSVVPSAPIGSNGFVASNYNITYVNGDITVNKANATITFNAINNSSNTVSTDTATVTLNATANSGATVTFSSSNTSVATVSGNIVTIKGVGTAIITANAAATSNYNAPGSATQTLTVTYPVIAGWSFTGNTATPNKVASNLTVADLTTGGTAVSFTLLSTSTPSASTDYIGASGTSNAGVPPNTGTTPYFQFSLNGATGYTFNITGFSFAARSTPTGVTGYYLRSSADNYTNNILTGTISNTSVWSLKSHSGLNVASGAGEVITYRLYGTGGTASSGNTGTNWKVDDISFNGFVEYNPTPIITASTSALATSFTQTSTTPSTVQSYTISADFLDANVTVTAPTGFEVSKSATSGFASSISFNKNSGGDIVGEPATVFVRMNTATLGTNSGNITHTSTGATTRNVSVTGLRTGYYYSKSTGDLNDLTTWGAEPSGSGSNPSNFSSAGMVYQVRNRATATISGNWTVSGSNSKVEVGDGINVTDLIIPANSILTGTVDVNNNGELTIENTTSPTIGTLATGSTIEYNNIAITVPQITYSNLKLSGTGTKTFAGNTTTIGGNLTFSNVTLDGSTSPFATISLGGNLTYVGSVTPPVDANSITLSTNGTAGGTQTITGAGNTVRWFRITTTTANTILMSTVGGSSNISVGNATSGGITLANSSVLNLNGNDLSFANVSGTGGASFILNTSGSISATASSDFNLFRSVTGSMGTIRFTSSANTVGNFTLNHTGATNTLTIGSNFNITGNLTLTDGTLAVDNFNITLKSTATTQALVPELGTGAAITYGTGKFVAERYIPKGLRAFRDLTPSVSGAGSIFANWQENGSFLGSFGTYVTGKAATKTFAEAKAATGFVDATTGLDLSASGSKSIFTYNNTNGTWNPGLSSSKDTALTAMKGYRVLVRGDRNWSMYLIPQANDMINATTLRATGSLITGTQTISGLNNAANGFSLVGNPYVAPIDWLAVSRTNINPTIWVLSPKTRAYVTVGTAGVVTPSGGGHNINQYIQPGQAFFVQTTAAGAASIQIEEADKVGSANVTSVFGAEAGTTSMLRIGLYKPVESVTLDMVDETVAVFGNYSNAVTGDDSYKMENPADNIMLVNGSQKLAIEARQTATANDVLPIELSKLSNNTNYQLKIDASGYTGTGFDAYVKDAYKKTETLVKSGAETAIDFTVDNTIAASYSNRFTVVFKPSVLPISSIDVQGVQQGSDVVLTINTVGERNISNYDVEKSTDGVAYSKLATVAAKNTATASYNVTDTKPVNGSNYYRVKVNGINEAATYSKVVIVKKAAAAAKYVLYPNPSKGNNVGLLLTQVNSGKYTITLRNMLGQQVHTEVVDHKGGNATIALRLKQVVANGQYTLSVSSDSNKQVVYQTNLLIQ